MLRLFPRLVSNALYLLFMPSSSDSENQKQETKRHGPPFEIPANMRNIRIFKIMLE